MDIKIYGMVEWIEKKYMKKQLDGWMDRKQQRDGWMDIKNVWMDEINRWMFGRKTKIYKKQMDGWMDIKKDGSLDGWI